MRLAAAAGVDPCPLAVATLGTRSIMKDKLTAAGWVPMFAAIMVCLALAYLIFKIEIDRFIYDVFLAE